MLRLKLHWQIFIALICATFISYFIQLNNFNIESSIIQFLFSLGTIFVRLLKMVIIPLIFTSIITGISGITNQTQLGRIGLKTIFYYFCTSFFAIVIGLVLCNIIQPGVGLSINEVSNFDFTKLNKPGSLSEILIRMIPLNPIKAASDGDMLAVIFFAILIGISISKTPSEFANPIRTFFNSLFQVIMTMTEMIIKFAPLGVLGLVIKALLTSGFGVFGDLLLYALTIFIGLSIHLLIILPTMFYLFTNINPITHFKGMLPALITAFSTSSSNATLPVTIRCVQENAKVSKSVSSFVLPLGATINMDGTALYECAGVLFIAQALGVPLDFYQQLIIVFTALLASIGAAGIPSAGLVMIFIVTQAVGFNDTDVAMIVGLMLAIDRPLDMMRTMVNIFSDSVGSAVIAKSEGEKIY